MNGPNRKRLDHEPPEWVGSEAEYFITVCAQPRGRNHFCHPSVGPIILESIGRRNEQPIWFCHLAILMPDHIHLLLSFPPEVASFSRVIANWKHWLSHQHAISWQENFFDHRIRGRENYGEKVDYIRQNPVRARLVGRAEDWPYAFVAGDLKG
jgi:REP element-mobilizing transposase RayT